MSEPTDERPHDVLAAEEFVVPARDPALHPEPVHDVLAAEEFVVPARDAALGSGPMQLPDEPYPAVEAHDVLAAEEFAMPAGRVGSGVSAGDDRGRRGGRVAAALGAAVAFVVLLWRRRR